MSKPPEILFQQIWDIWPNKRDKLSSQKAFEWGHSQGWFTVTELSSCVRLYCESEPEVVKSKQVLGNWIRENKYKPFLESIRNVGIDNALIQQSKDNELARKICQVWNEKKRVWWLEIVDINDRAKHVESALKDEFFRENWEKGIEYLRDLFKRRRMESEYLRNLVPSITWFCNREHNVLAKILEGEYGRPKRKKTTVSNPDPSSELDRHGEDIIKVIQLGFSNQAFKQEVTMLGSDNEVQAVNWYVLESSKGFALRFKGRLVEVRNCEKYNDSILSESAISVFRELKSLADSYNKSGYSPDLDKQKKLQISSGIIKKECPL